MIAVKPESMYAKVIIEPNGGSSRVHERIDHRLQVHATHPDVITPSFAQGMRAEVASNSSIRPILARCLEVRAPEHEEYVAWIGGEFDPEAFGCQAVNQELQRLS